MKVTITIESVDKSQRCAEEFVSRLIELRTLLSVHGAFLNENDDAHNTLTELYQSVVEREAESKLVLPLPTNMWMNIFAKLITHTEIKEVGK